MRSRPRPPPCLFQASTGRSRWSGTREFLAAALREIRARPASSGSVTKIVAIDGPGGAGKSSLAGHLAAAPDDAPILHTDDFARWDNPIDWWPELLERALKPLAAGKPARFTPADWAGEKKDAVTVEPTEFVVLEGVSASRKEFRPYLTYAIWVDAPAGLRLERGSRGAGWTHEIAGSSGWRTRTPSSRARGSARRPTSFSRATRTSGSRRHPPRARYFAGR